MVKAEFTIRLVWKDFKTNLDLVHNWLKSNAGPLYTGCSGNSFFEVHFSTEPDQSVVDAVNTYWNELAADGTEAKQYVSKEIVAAKTQELKDGLLAKNWDQMSLAERKLMVGQTPSHVELGLVS